MTGAVTSERGRRDRSIDKGATGKVYKYDIKLRVL